MALPQHPVEITPEMLADAVDTFHRESALWEAMTFTVHGPKGPEPYYRLHRRNEASSWPLRVSDLIPSDHVDFYEVKADAVMNFKLGKILEVIIERQLANQLYGVKLTEHRPGEDRG